MAPLHELAVPSEKLTSPPPLTMPAVPEMAPPELASAMPAPVAPDNVLAPRVIAPLVESEISPPVPTPDPVNATVPPPELLVAKLVPLATSIP